MNLTERLIRLTERPIRLYEYLVSLYKYTVGLYKRPIRLYKYRIGFIGCPIRFTERSIGLYGLFNFFLLLSFKGDFSLTTPHPPQGGGWAKPKNGVAIFGRGVGGAV